MHNTIINYTMGRIVRLNSIASIPEEINKLITPDFLSDKDFINKWLNQPAKFLAFNKEERTWNSAIR